MPKFTLFSRSLFLLGSLTVLGTATAIPNTATDGWYGLPQMPRLTGWGLTGTDTYGKGEAIVPLVGYPTSFLFADAQGKGENYDSWSGSAGLGFRHNYRDERILGAYVFADRSVSPHRQLFWDVSPGIESMGKIWDFRANGYFPAGGSSHFVGDFFGSQLGDFNFVEHVQHTEFDRIFQLTETVGNGGDGEVGHVIPHFPHTRFYLGGYFFAPRHTENIKGASARLLMPINHYFALEGRDTYDNINHNTALVALRLSLGGIQEDQISTDVQTRIMDPIERNISTQNSGSSLNVIERQQSLPGAPKEIVFRKGIYFFTNVGGSTFNAALGKQNCTINNPCNDPSFNQATLNSIAGFDPNAIFYFKAPGIDPYSADPQISIPGGQSFWGRTDNYQAPAPDGDRPFFEGSFLIATGNNSFNNLNFDGRSYAVPVATGQSVVAIDIMGANNVKFNSVGIANYGGAPGIPGTAGTPDGTDGTNGQAAIGINIDASSKLQFKNVSVTDIFGGRGGVGGDGSARGLSVSTTGGDGGDGAFAGGIIINNSSDIVMNTMTVGVVLGGVGGDGGSATGGDGSASGGAGNGTGGVGGAAGSAAGIVINNGTGTYSLSGLQMITVAGGLGGNGGAGTGGKGLAGGALGGAGGNGIGGDAGTGGASTGILISNSSATITVQDFSLNSMQGGLGGAGGNATGGDGSEGETLGGIGGEATGGNGATGGVLNGINILNNTGQITLNSFAAVSNLSGMVGGMGGSGGTAHGGNGGFGINSRTGAGGNGGAGGSATGGSGAAGQDGTAININSPLATINVSGIVISEVTGGGGGAGGDATGGNGAFGGSGATAGGNGGAGGQAISGAGADAGAANGIAVTDSSPTIQVIDFQNIIGGLGGAGGLATGGDGASGGSAITGGGTGGLGGFGNAALAAGGAGGGATGILIDNSNFSIENITFNNIIAGAGGAGGTGNGGRGGDGGQSTIVGPGGDGANGGDGTGGNGGLGGNGTGIFASNNSIISVMNITGDIVTGGKGGDGGNGNGGAFGTGGAGTPNGNDGVIGNGTGGNGGDGGDGFGIAKDGTSTVNTSGIINITGFAVGVGGAAGIGNPGTDGNPGSDGDTGECSPGITC